MEDELFPNKEKFKEWQNNPKYWICGMFYFNKSDNRLLPPKRNENLGFTVNFAKPKSVLFFIVMLGFFAFVLTMILKNQN